MFRNTATYERGDRVVYCVTKQSVHPGPRAKLIRPAEKGDNCSYVVDKFWVVAETLDQDKLLLKTRGGKFHLMVAADPNLRHARFWERLFYRDRFPEILASPLPATNLAGAED